jgi:hypothetical protein
MSTTFKPPTPRPAKGFGTLRAQKWVLTAAILTAIIYAFRRLVEPSLSAAPPQGGQAQKLIGSGSPPPALGEWAVAYGTGFLLLSILTLGAPEVAGSLAMLLIAGELLTNGLAIAADIGNLEKQLSGSTSSSSSTPKVNPNTGKGAGQAAGQVTNPQPYPGKGFTG